MFRAMTTTQLEARKKQEQSQRRQHDKQEQKVEAIIIQHGNSLLAKALAARLRRKNAIAHRQPHRAIRFQRDMKRVKQMLGAIVQESEVERWLAAPNAVLGGVRPIDKIRLGKTRQVIELLAVVQESIYV